MGLKVWLPLNGDLHNQGCSNVTVTNNGATVDNNGKIGSCYYFNGSAWIKITLPPDMTTIQNTSVCAWVKSTNSTLALGGISHDTGNTTIGSCTLYSSGWQFSGNGGWTYVSGGTVANTNVWHHVCCTIDNINIITYLDGIKITTATLTSKNALTNLTSSNFIEIGCDHPGGNEYLTGYVNDFRVYDHCLSAAEVREISQGLVLHYKLDDAVGFTDLIARNVNVTAYNNHGNTNNPTTVTYLSQQYNGDRIIQYSATPTSNAISSIKSQLYSHGIYNWNRTFKANTKYVFWIYYKPITHLDTVAGGIASNIGGWTEIPPIAVGGGWYRVGQYRNGTVTTDKTDNIFVSYKTPSAVAGDNIIIYFASPHLLEGTTEIPPYDYPSTIIQDSSGYNHNGTITGTLTLSSDTPRYSASSKFIAGSKISGTGFLTTQSPVFTLSYWLYMDGGTYTRWADIMSFTGSATFRQETSNTAGTSLGWYNYPIGTSSGTGGTTMTVGTWTHLAFSSDGTKFYFYKNGALYSTITMSGTAWTPNGNFTIGDSNNMFMSMSDFRIYCTALDADAIRQLYEVGAKVDNKGNLHTFELLESNNGRELLAVPLTTSYGNHINIYNNYDVNGEITLTGGSSIGSYYIPINPSGKTYYYDIEISTDSGNVFYIGFQRYDANKTARSNDATVYLPGLSGSNEARTHKHYHGTVDLSTDGVNPCAFTSLRILNDWSGANNRHATIHKISLREVSTLQNTKINKQGKVITTELIEMNDKFRVHKNGIIETNEIIEL